MSTTTAKPPPLPGRLLGRADLAEVFGVAKSTIAAWERDGRLPRALRIGRKPRWRPDDIAKLIAGAPED